MASQDQPRGKINSSDETEATASSDGIPFASPQSPEDRPVTTVLPRLEEPSREEAMKYYLSFPSTPRLLGRTSSGVKPWKFANPVAFLSGFAWGREAEMETAMAAGLVGPHRIHETWEKTTLAKVKVAIAPIEWTSIDVVRMGDAELPEQQRPVVIWVGVHPRAVPTTSWALISYVLRNVRIALDDDGLGDVECELRASLISLAAGPRLLPPARDRHRKRQHELEIEATLAVGTTLGQAIAPRNNPTFEGTLGLYLAPAPATVQTAAQEQSQQPAPDTVWALTCHHVVYPDHSEDGKEGPGNAGADESNNGKLDKETCTIDVLLPADTHLEKALETARELVQECQDLVDMDSSPSFPSSSKSSIDQERLVRNTHLLESLEVYAASAEARIIGRVEHAPPRGVNEEPKFTRDWALIALDKTRFPEGFSFDNAVDLMTDKLDRTTVTLVKKALGDVSYEFPQDGQMRLGGIIPLRQLQGGQIPHPFVTTKDGELRHIVLKRGRTTGVTVGIALDINPVVRNYFGKEYLESRKLAIIHISHKSKRHLMSGVPCFSKKGDSGAAIFDLLGRVAGMLVGGTSDDIDERQVFGQDITYAVPAEDLMEDIEKTVGSKVRIL